MDDNIKKITIKADNGYEYTFYYDESYKVSAKIFSDEKSENAVKKLKEIANFLEQEKIQNPNQFVDNTIFIANNSGLGARIIKKITIEQNKETLPQDPFSEFYEDGKLNVLSINAGMLSRENQNIFAILEHELGHADFYIKNLPDLSVNSLLNLMELESAQKAIEKIFNNIVNKNEKELQINPVYLNYLKENHSDLYKDIISNDNIDNMIKLVEDYKELNESFIAPQFLAISRDDEEFAKSYTYIEQLQKFTEQVEVILESLDNFYQNLDITNLDSYTLVQCIKDKNLWEDYANIVTQFNLLENYEVYNFENIFSYLINNDTTTAVSSKNLFLALNNTKTEQDDEEKQKLTIQKSANILYFDASINKDKGDIVNTFTEFLDIYTKIKKHENILSSIIQLGEIYADINVGDNIVGAMQNHREAMNYYMGGDKYSPYDFHPPHSTRLDYFKEKAERLSIDKLNEFLKETSENGKDISQSELDEIVKIAGDLISIKNTTGDDEISISTQVFKVTFSNNDVTIGSR